MKAIKRISILVLLFATIGYVNIFAQANSTVKLNIQPQSKLKIDGVSTLHDFTVNAKVVKGYLIIDQENTGETTKASDSKVDSLSVVIPVKKLNTDKSSMNDNMDDALKADDNPNITYKLINIDKSSLPTVVGKSAELNTSGELTIAGKAQKIQMKVKSTLQKDGTYEFVGQKKINMKDYGVKPPTMFFGTITVHPNVTVKFDIVASAK